MRKLIFLGQELDIDKEHELFSNDLSPEHVHGFTAVVTYNPEGSKGYLGGQTFNNLTEVHHLFEPGSIAFESDIHHTGCTREIDDIDTVTITVADKLEENY